MISRHFILAFPETLLNYIDIWRAIDTIMLLKERIYDSGVIIFDLMLFELCLLNGLCLLIKV